MRPGGEVLRPDQQGAEHRAQERDDARVEQDRVQSLQERVLPGEQHLRVAGAQLPEPAERDEVGELAAVVERRVRRMNVATQTASRVHHLRSIAGDYVARR